MAKKVSAKALIEQQAEEIAAPVAEEYGVRIYDVDYTRIADEYQLTVYIDKEGGVNIGDCENVSRKLSDMLDEKDIIQDGYTLYVSSPGLGRKLTKDRHFAASIGEKVEIRTYADIEGIGAREISGTLLSFDGTSVTIRPDRPEPKGKKKKPAVQEEQDPMPELIMNRKDISTVRLQLDF